MIELRPYLEAARDRHDEAIPGSVDRVFARAAARQGRRRMMRCILLAFALVSAGGAIATTMPPSHPTVLAASAEAPSYFSPSAVAAFEAVGLGPESWSMLPVGADSISKVAAPVGIVAMIVVMVIGFVLVAIARSRPQRSGPSGGQP